MPGPKERRKAAQAGQQAWAACPVFNGAEALSWPEFWKRLCVYLKVDGARFRYLLPLLRYLMQCEGYSDAHQPQCDVKAKEFAWFYQFFKHPDDKERHMLIDLERMNEARFFWRGASTDLLKEQMKVQPLSEESPTPYEEMRSLRPKNTPARNHANGDFVVRPSQRQYAKDAPQLVLTVIPEKGAKALTLPLAYSEGSGFAIEHGPAAKPPIHTPDDKRSFYSLYDFVSALKHEAEHANISFDNKGKQTVYSCKRGGGNAEKAEPRAQHHDPAENFNSGGATAEFGSERFASAVFNSISSTQSDFDLSTLLQSLTTTGGGFSYVRHDIEGPDGTPLEVYSFPAELLGKGTFGTVVKGYQVLGMETVPCAVKCVHAGRNGALSEQDKREIEIMKKVEHEYCVRMFGSKAEEDKLVMCLELMDNSLAGLIKASKASIMTPEHGFQILSGLDYLHRIMKIVHRDLKPANVLYARKKNGAPGYTLKLSDFGQSKPLENADATATAANHGTPWYMAPEMLIRMSRSEKTDERLLEGQWYQADVWSAGCTFLQMFTLRPPWGDVNLYSLIPKVLNPQCMPVIPESTPAALRAVLTSCLLRTPEDRSNPAALLQLPYFTLQG
eukprot:TRINITY_DN7205_c0_g1_i1.p1 TRINITY_DN7205_c0_g1~~TRINITY_DN7205_c0_g1_i1.p1  ORF type:complete len:615 (+),score=196.06 TRINITY_DN7205_c0_g1_i1:67-1911(+)